MHLGNVRGEGANFLVQAVARAFELLQLAFRVLLDKDFRNGIGNLRCQFLVGVFYIDADQLRILDRLHADIGLQFDQAQTGCHRIQHRAREHQLGKGLRLAFAGNDGAINAFIDVAGLIHEDG